VGAELFHAGGQKTGGQADTTTLKVSFRNFVKAHKAEVIIENVFEA
jgi:hypothetical protein